MRSCWWSYGCLGGVEGIGRYAGVGDGGRRRSQVESDRGGCGWWVSFVHDPEIIICDERRRGFSSGWVFFRMPRNVNLHVEGAPRGTRMTTLTIL